jgi:hypothetical protein
MLRLLRLAFGVVLLGVLWPAMVRAETLEPSAFFGTFQGMSIGENAEGLAPRDLQVTIEPLGQGFTITWETVSRGTGTSSSAKVYAIDFEPTPRAGIFTSKVRLDKFGNRVPLDPMRGEPYSWARIAGRTLTVYALLIVDDGSYEMQIYDRTRTADGLDLTFRRYAEGQAIRTVEGKLVQVK